MRIVWSLLAFFALSVPLTWLWLTGVQDSYEQLFSAVAGSGLESVGVTGIAESPARKRFINYVPFLVLMLITPRLSPRRRLVGTALGILVIFLSHVGLVAWEALAHTSGRPTQDAFSTVLPAMIFADALPFILWAVIANRVLRDALGRAFQGLGSPAASVGESPGSEEPPGS